MIRRIALASTALVALTTPAAADPVSIGTIVLAAFTAVTGVAAPVGIVGTALAGIVGGAVVAGVGILLTALLTVIPKPENGTIAIQQPLPYRIYGYGQARVPGAIMFKEQSAGYLGVVQALNGHLISAFTGLYLNDDFVTVPIVDGCLVGPVSRMVNTDDSNDDPRYKDNVITIDSRLGTDDPAYYGGFAFIFADVWPTSAVGKGIASLSMICGGVSSAKFASVYPYGEPKPSPVVQQYPVFDPRDPAQSPTDPTTWAYSDNPVLCILHFRCFSAYGSMLPYASAIAPNLAAWIQAANDCDDLMPLKAGGTEARYRVGGYTTTQQDRRSTLQAMLAACDGWMCDRGDGTIDIKVGKYVAPTVVLTDDDIIGFSIQRGTATKDKINRVTARYTSPANGYISVETNPLNDLTDQALRFGPPRAVQLDLTWCQYTGQASRLQKREFIRQSRTTRGTLVLKLSGLNAAYERCVLINSNTIPRLSGVVIEPSKPVIDIVNARVTINFISSGPDIDDYDPATDESPAPYVPQRPNAVGIPIPENVAVTIEETSSAGSTSVFAVVSWDTPLFNGEPYTSLTYTLQYRTSAVGSTPAGGWVQETADTTIEGTRTFATTGAIPIGANLDFQVFSGAGAGQLSDGSVIVTVSTALIAPGTPPSITATGAAGSATIAVEAPTSDNLASIQIYRAVSGAPFASSSAVGQPIAATSGGSVTYTDTVPAGTYDYFATAIATSGAGSAPAGPSSATVT